MTPRAPRLAGALAAAAALAVAELVSGALGALESPLVSVAQQAVNLTPGAVGEPIIDAIGTLDKPLAVAVTVLGVLALGSLLGRWWVERRPWAWVGLAVFAGVAVLAVVTRPYPPVAGAGGALAGAVVAAGVLHLLLRGSR